VTTQSPSPRPQHGFTPPRPHPRNELGIAALVVGILAMVLCWVPLAGFVLGLTTVMIGVAGRRRIKRDTADNKGATITGIVLGIAATVVGGVITAGVLYLIIDYQTCIANAPDREAYAQCH